VQISSGQWIFFNGAHFYRGTVGAETAPPPPPDRRKSRPATGKTRFENGGGAVSTPPIQGNRFGVVTLVRWDCLHLLQSLQNTISYVSPDKPMTRPSEGGKST
jgi:hypothetical protein